MSVDIKDPDDKGPKVATYFRKALRMLELPAADAVAGVMGFSAEGEPFAAAIYSRQEMAGVSRSSSAVPFVFAADGDGELVGLPTISVPIDSMGTSVGSGSDDSAAWIKAHAEAKVRGGHVEFTAGKTYLLQTIDFSTPSDVVPLICAGQATVKKITNNGAPLIQISTAVYGGYVPASRVSGITFDADGKADHACLAYHLARWRFERCGFKGAAVAGHSHYGGVGTGYDWCDFAGNSGRGVQFDKFGANKYPNFHRIYNSRVLNNGGVGIFFDHGRCLILGWIDLEGNGTTGAGGHAGLWVGDNVGEEDTGRPAVGILAEGTIWAEDNGGDSAVRLGSGHNVFKGIYTKANRNHPDIHIVAGTHDTNAVCADTAVENIREESTVGSGNRLNGKFAGTVTINPMKTVQTPASAWTAYIPSVSPHTGSIASLGTCVGKYLREGSKVSFTASALITTNGTGGGWLNIDLPPGLPVAAGRTFVLIGIDTGSSSKAVIARLTSAATIALVQTVSGLGYPGADGSVITISGTYETDAA